MGQGLLSLHKFQFDLLLGRGIPLHKPFENHDAFIKLAGLDLTEEGICLDLELIVLKPLS